MHHLMIAIAVTLPTIAQADELPHLYPAKIGEQYGYVDGQGKVVIGPGFDWAAEFQKGLALVLRSGEFSFIDRVGVVKFKSPCRGDVSSFSEGLAHGSIGLGFFYFTREGKLLPNRFAAVQDFSEGLAAVKIDPDRFESSRKPFHGEETGAWGFADKTGEVVIPAKFARVKRFSNGLAPVYFGVRVQMCTDLDDGRWGRWQVGLH